MKKQKWGILLLSILLSSASFAQQGVTIGTANPPDASAILDLQSTSKGFLLSRLTTAQRNAIVAPAAGLEIYNTDTDCIEAYFVTGGWKAVQCGCNSFPDATFNVPTGYTNIPATLTANTPGILYSWTFQSGSPATSSTQSTAVTWNSPGTYAISLTATDLSGCSATYTDNIVIQNCPPPTTMNFTSCGASGQNGPNQTQCNNTYGPGVVTVAGNGVQRWTVPYSGNYRITAAGGRGGMSLGDGNTNRGPGAVMECVVALTAGQVINVVVGQEGLQNGGGNTANGGGAGGGGSFVFITGQPQPLIVAGGGGGASITNTSGSPAFLIGKGGATGPDGLMSWNNDPVHGTNGNSALFGGYGWNAMQPTNFTAFTGGGYNAVGGYGGGGWNRDGSHAGGGGGGYSGGGGGNYGTNTGSGNTDGRNGGGGGGSYITGSATGVKTSNGQYNGSGTFNGSPITNLNTYNSGMGYVNIVLACP